MRKTIFAFVFALSASLNGWADKYENPVISGYHPDPSVCRVGDDYYLVNSTFNFFPGVPIFHSKDLIHWEQIGHCLNRNSQLPLGTANEWTGIYAPTIRYHEGTFYMVTTNVGFGGNFFVTAKDPAGPWSEPIWMPEQEGIDPSFYFEDGKCYTLSNPRDTIFLAELNVADGKLNTKPRPIWTGTGGRYPEGPHIIRKDGWYYLMISEGGTEYGHGVTIARSKNIYGPYEANPRNPILTHFSQKAQNSPIQGTGHADMVQAQDGSWWLVFLAFRPQNGSHHLLGRETFLAPVTWDAEGWPVVNEGKPIALDMDCKTLPQVPVTQPSVRQNFVGIDHLPFEWVYLRNPFMENYSLNHKKDHLSLKATDETLENGSKSPTFVARRQQHIDFSASASVELEKPKLGDEAGLTVYMSGNYHFDICLQKSTKGCRLLLRYHVGVINHVERELTLKTDKAFLKVEGDKNLYHFFYSTDGKNYQELGAANTNLLSTETAGGFTGITLGLYAIAKSEPSAFWANIDWFDYQGK